MSSWFEFACECGAIVETTDDATIIIVDMPIALGPDEAENLAIGLMRAAQWQRMKDAEEQAAERTLVTKRAAGAARSSSPIG